MAYARTKICIRSSILRGRVRAERSQRVLQGNWIFPNAILTRLAKNAKDKLEYITADTKKGAYKTIIYLRRLIFRRLSLRASSLSHVTCVILEHDFIYIIEWFNANEFCRRSEIKTITERMPRYNLNWINYAFLKRVCAHRRRCTCVRTHSVR